MLHITRAGFRLNVDIVDAAVWAEAPTPCSSVACVDPGVALRTAFVFGSSVYYPITPNPARKIADLLAVVPVLTIDSADPTFCYIRGLFTNRADVLELPANPTALQISATLEYITDGRFKVYCSDLVCVKVAAWGWAPVLQYYYDDTTALPNLKLTVLDASILDVPDYRAMPIATRSLTITTNNVASQQLSEQATANLRATIARAMDLVELELDKKIDVCDFESDTVESIVMSGSVFCGRFPQMRDLYMGSISRIDLSQSPAVKQIVHGAF